MKAALNPTHRLLQLCRMDRTWVRGEGGWLFDESGRRFLDGYAQYGGSVTAHRQSEPQRALRSTMASRPWCNPCRVPHASALAEKRLRAAPGMRHCVFTTSGAEAVEAESGGT